MVEAITCLIVSFTRVEGVRSILASLPLKLVSKVYVAIDGPRTEKDKESQSAIRLLLEDFSAKNAIEVKIWQRQINLGVAVSIISAIDWLFSIEEFGVIIEDDLLLGTSTFEYFISNISRYRESKDVVLISGNQFFANQISGEWTHYPLIWGWATWQMKWSELRLGILKRPNFVDFIKISPVSGFWVGGALRVLRGSLDTWDIPLANYMYSKKLFCKLPIENRISNIGNDEHATHTIQNVFPLNVPTSKSIFDGSNLSSPSHREARKIDLELNKKVFKIKLRHILLPLYVLCCESTRLKQDIKLQDRLAKVVLPSH